MPIIITPSNDKTGDITVSLMIKNLDSAFNSVTSIHINQQLPVALDKNKPYLLCMIEGITKDGDAIYQVVPIDNTNILIHLLTNTNNTTN